MKVFNKDKALRQIKIKQNKNTYIKKVSIVLSCFILLIGIMYFTFAKFEQNSEEYTLINGKVKFFKCDKEIGKEWTFDYTGDEQEFIARCNGYYKLEVWGAQGGSASTNIGGYGGYSVGTINLNSKDIIFLNVGGAGTDSGPVSPGNYIVTKGGYNGGGDSIVSPRSGEIISIGSGGGATSISKKSGQLKDLEVYKGTLKNNSYYESNDIIIVAGGGGGAGFYTSSINGKGGHAGGFNGVNGYTTNGVYGTGGTQIAPGYETGYSSTPVAIGSFGQGASTGCDANNLCWGGTGGGGFFGGGGTIAWHYTNGGGGGSGYIANPNLTNKSMYCYNCTTSNDVATKTESTTCTKATATANCSKEGNGYAKITYLGDDKFVNIYSAVEDEIYYYYGDNKVVLGTTDSTGKLENVFIPKKDNITLYSSVAKNPNNLNNYYTKTVSISNETTDVYLMPNNSIYWYGYNNGLSITNSANGWTSAAGSMSFITPTFNKNNISATLTSSNYTSLATTEKKSGTSIHTIINMNDYISGNTPTMIGTFLTKNKTYNTGAGTGYHDFNMYTTKGLLYRTNSPASFSEDYIVIYYSRTPFTTYALWYE